MNPTIAQRIKRTPIVRRPVENSPYITCDVVDRFVDVLTPFDVFVFLSTHTAYIRGASVLEK